MSHTPSQIRNIAVIAHVDHGKTTLADAILRQTGIFRDNQAVRERVLDSNDQERERGITILSKNIAFDYAGCHINMIDTPGHADFGGEVERVLKMADACLLLVDAFEGPMPQTRFVLKKAFAHGLKPIVVINKCDRAEARPDDVLDEIFDLFVELDASDEQLDFAHVFTSARDGWAVADLNDPRDSIRPLLDIIVSEVPAPDNDPDGDLRMLVSTLDHNEYIGRIGIGRIFAGTIHLGNTVAIMDRHGNKTTATIEYLYGFEGLKRVQITEASAGDICAFGGIRDIGIGYTVSSLDNPGRVDVIDVDEPTMTMLFRINDSPFAGREGKYVTSRKLRERLYHELESNVALRVNDTDSAHEFLVSGRGILHLGVFIETMRREGYELSVSKPHVIFKEIDGVRHEPVETVSVDAPEDSVGKVIELFGSRGGAIRHISQRGTLSHVDIHCSTRGLIGIRNRLMNLTKGEAVLHHVFHKYEPVHGEIPRRANGVLVASTTGSTTTYSLLKLQDRGTFFVRPDENVYCGQVVGVHRHGNDIAVNVCRKKELNNIRSSTKDIEEKLNAALPLTLEEALEFIEDDELVEITPKFVRIRKRELNERFRIRDARRRDALAAGTD